MGQLLDIRFGGILSQSAEHVANLADLDFSIATVVKERKGLLEFFFANVGLKVICRLINVFLTLNLLIYDLTHLTTNVPCYLLQYSIHTIVINDNHLNHALPVEDDQFNTTCNKKDTFLVKLMTNL